MLDEEFTEKEIDELIEIIISAINFCENEGCHQYFTAKEFKLLKLSLEKLREMEGK